MFFPSPSTWKMVKDAPNHILMNIIVLAQTLHRILEDVDVPIFPVVFINPDSTQPSFKTNNCANTGITLSTFCVEVNTICI